MSLSKEIILSIGDYAVQLSGNLSFYVNDSLDLIFIIRKWSVDNANARDDSSVFDLTGMMAYLMIENGQQRDSIESVSINDNKIVFKLTNKYTIIPGIGRMQLKLVDDDGCELKLPPFKYEIRNTINEWNDLNPNNALVLANESRSALLTEDGRLMLMSMTSIDNPNVVRVNDLPNTSIVKPDDYMLVNSDGVTKKTSVSNIKISEHDRRNIGMIPELCKNIDEIANKGTTIDVIKNAVEDEVRKMVDDGAISPMTIGDNTIGKRHLKKDIQFGIDNLDYTIINRNGEVNLFDSAKGEYGWIDSKTGSIVVSNSDPTKDWTSDFIPCIPGETIRKDENSSNKTNIQDVCFYAKDRTFISGIQLKPTDNWRTFKIPDNAYFFRFDLLSSKKYTEKIYSVAFASNSDGVDITLNDNIKIKGENIIGQIGFDNLSEDLIKPIFKEVVEVNLFDSAKGEYGWIDPNTGNIKNNSDPTKDWTSDFIPCIPGETIRKDENSSNKTNTQDVCFYAKDRSFISGIQFKPTNNWRTFKIPDNAYFFRFDLLSSKKSSEEIYGMRSPDGETQGYHLNDNIKIKGENIIGQIGFDNLSEDLIKPIFKEVVEVNLFDSAKGEYGWIDSKTGSVVVSNSDPTKDWTSDFIPCTPGETIIKDENSSNKTNTQDVCFYAKDRSFISGIQFKPTNNWRTFKIPDNAYFFRFDLLSSKKYTEKIYGMRSPDGKTQGYHLNDNIKIKGENITGSISLDKLGDDIVNKATSGPTEVNLFDSAKGEYGWIDSKTGDVKFSNSDPTKDWTSDFIPCTPGETIRKDENSSNKTNAQDVCFYAKDRSFISGIQLEPTDNWRTFKIPDNAYFFRFDMLSSKKSSEEIYGMRDNPENTLSDNIKIKKSNILGMGDDDSSNDRIVLYNEDGDKYVISINSDGELIVKPAISSIPPNMQKFTARGESCIRGDILVAPHTDNNRIGWLMIFDRYLCLKKYKQLTSFAYNFRKYKNKKGEIRYVYCQTVNNEHPKMPMNGGYDNTKMVVSDKNLDTLYEYYLKAHGTVSEGHPGENHDVIYFDDKHYLLTAYVRSVVNNIPGQPGEYKALNCVIQEVKNDEVVFHWESIDHVELYNYACKNKNFSGYPNTQPIYNDYYHLNSVQVDPLNSNHLLVSARFIGLMKIDKKTGDIIWMFGRGGRIDFSNMTVEQVPYLQHHMTRLSDNSIICFDNSGCATNNTRICRYWLDEENMTLLKFKEYITNHPRSAHMGGVDMIKEDVFLINYGGAYTDITFEEYDFKLNKQNLSFRFNDGTDCYRVWKDMS